jgi:2-polyprenyl-3-methyl-5-hydroxy-6-metoxy-1,4-benzoquinol methylase
VIEGVRERVAARFRSRFLRGYSRGKIARDPVYEAASAHLTQAPLLDIGCGIGLLSFYLREQGFAWPILAIDHDTKKIEAARAAASADRELSFRAGDARERLEFAGNVTLLDLLHYFDSATQQRILANVAAAVGPGCVAIIRDGVRDGSWRYRMTYLQESFSRMIGWLRAERLHFPTLPSILAAFEGFEVVTASRLSGRTPFNNYLFVFRRPLSGITNE